MAEVKLINVSKIYEGGNKAVKEVNIEIREKEFVVLVGPSGCGKSTTLRMIAGLEEISEGELFIDGKLVNHVSPKDRDIAMVFQNYALYPHMTVYDNMAFGLKLRKFSKQEIKERVLNAAKILGIEEYLDRKPKALSGGQRQRVAVGRAIVRKPKVFLFDEPLSNLDAKLRVQMRTEISRLHRNLSATMIYVTHDQTEAMTMGDRIVIMKDGVVHQVDTPLNLYNNPVNKFVAGFIGSPSMNFVDGTLLSENGSILFKSLGGELNLNLNNTLKAKVAHLTGKEITLGIRPENIHTSNSGGTSDYQSVKTILDVVEPMGNEIFIYFNLDQNQVTARIGAATKPEPGSEVSLYFDSGKLHFFDKETGLAIN
ncbi:MAG: sn-glycerol-3-phosphate ABC transporter ATP-binding protein UgpC [Ignavibacteriales bacterium]|nr:sn-glycerol-3-phosphate ABC transporter ATP-binding protein UgpC [Ignavibacteriales bacterium]